MMNTASMPVATEIIRSYALYLWKILSTPTADLFFDRRVLDLFGPGVDATDLFRIGVI